MGPRYPTASIRPACRNHSSKRGGASSPSASLHGARVGSALRRVGAALSRSAASPIARRRSCSRRPRARRAVGSRYSRSIAPEMKPTGRRRSAVARADRVAPAARARRCAARPREAREQRPRRRRAPDLARAALGAQRARPLARERRPHARSRVAPCAANCGRDRARSRRLERGVDGGTGRHRDARSRSADRRRVPWSASPLLRHRGRRGIALVARRVRQLDAVACRSRRASARSAFGALQRAPSRCRVRRARHRAREPELERTAEAAAHPAGASARPPASAVRVDAWLHRPRWLRQLPARSPRRFVQQVRERPRGVRLGRCRRTFGEPPAITSALASLASSRRRAAARARAPPRPRCSRCA